MLEYYKSASLVWGSSIWCEFGSMYNYFKKSLSEAQTMAVHGSPECKIVSCYLRIQPATILNPVAHADMLWVGELWLLDTHQRKNRKSL